MAKYNHYIVTLENSEEFEANEYDYDKIIAGESKITWRSLSYTQR